MFTPKKDSQYVAEANRILRDTNPVRDKKYVSVYVDGVHMGAFRKEASHFDEIGLEYSLKRIWDNKLVLDRIDGRNYYYRTI